MATGITLSGTSNLTSGSRILLAAAKEAFEPAAPNPDLVESERIPTGVKQWDINTYARLSNASALTEGVDLGEVQQLVTANTPITPTEHGIIATLSKRLIRRQGDSSVVSVAGRQLAASLRRRMDLDVIAIYDTYTKSVGGASTTLDVTYVQGTVAYLMTDNSSAYGPAPMPVVGALHAEQISDIVADLADPGAVVSSRMGLSAEMLQRWWRGTDRVYGVPIIHAGNISRTTTSDKAAKGAIFAKESIYLVIANDADVTEDDDPSLRAIEYGIFQEWGEALRADPWGCEIHSTAIASV